MSASTTASQEITATEAVDRLLTVAVDRQRSALHRASEALLVAMADELADRPDVPPRIRLRGAREAVAAELAFRRGEVEPVSTPSPEWNAQAERERTEHRWALHCSGVHVECRSSGSKLASEIDRCSRAGKVERLHAHDFEGPLVCGCNDFGVEP